MDTKPGDTVYVEFCTTRFDTGAATDADSLPVGTLNRNGADTGVSVTVANLDAGRYKASFVIPATYVPGDVLNLTIAATVNSVAGKACVWTDRVGTGVPLAGTASAGAAGSITLAGGSAVDDYYKDCLVAVVAGTGAGQTRLVTAYNGTTKVASIDPDWLTDPDNTSVFVVLPAGLVDLGRVRGQTVTATAGFSFDAETATQLTVAANLDAAVSGRASHADALSILAAVAAVDADVLTRLSASHFDAVVGTPATTSVCGDVAAVLAAVEAITVPTPSVVAAAVWTDLLAGADFAVNLSVGWLLRTYIDDRITSRMPATTVLSGGPTLANNFAITFFRGEARRIRWQMDPNPPGGVVGRTIQFTMRKKLDQNPVDVIKSTDPLIGGIEVIDGPGGTADIILTSADTAGLKLDAKDDDGNPVLDERGFQVGIWQADVQFVDAGHEAVASVGTVTLQHPVRNFPTI